MKYIKLHLHPDGADSIRAAIEGVTLDGEFRYMEETYGLFRNADALKREAATM